VQLAVALSHSITATEQKSNAMNRLSSTLAGLLLLLGSQVQAESVESMLQEMAIIEKNTPLLQAAIEDGVERAQLCFRCHGDDGNSKRDYIPNLASQNAAYLFTQFEHFANGVRKDYVMSKLATALTKEDRINIALYFSQKPVVVREQPVAASSKGEQIYKTTCFVCHGNAGHGSSQYPRIAGQPYEYLTKTLMRFMHNDPDRKNSPMIGVVQNMDEQQLRDVASYIAHMP